jgi:hypothetical protein
MTVAGCSEKDSRRLASGQPAADKRYRETSDYY